MIETADFGRVVLVAVGATIVGSINHVKAVGESYRKGDEHGYFAFGGSTVLSLFLVRRACVVSCRYCSRCLCLLSPCACFRPILPLSLSLLLSL